MINLKEWGRRGEWYVVGQFVLFALIFGAPFVLPNLVDWERPWNFIGIGLSLVLGASGGLIALAGLLSLGSNLTAVPYPKEDAELVEQGAYRVVRHPIYSGIIFGAFSWGLLNNHLLTLLLAFFLFLFFDVKARREERWLCEKYDGYAAYQKRVRKLIPWIY